MKTLCSFALVLSSLLFAIPAHADSAVASYDVTGTLSLSSVTGNPVTESISYSFVLDYAPTTIPGETGFTGRVDGAINFTSNGPLALFTNATLVSINPVDFNYLEFTNGPGYSADAIDVKLFNINIVPTPGPPTLGSEIDFFACDAACVADGFSLEENGTGTFTAVDPPSNQVPETSSLFMLLVGIAALTALLQNRNRSRGRRCNA